MLAETAAKIFHDWAVREGLLSESPIQPTSSDAELSMISPNTEGGKVLLRQKRILAVGFNEGAHEVTAFTKLAAPSGKKALKNLPNQIDDVAVKYRQGSHTIAGDTPPTPFGGPAYIVRQNASGQNYYSCGSSISVGNCVDAGTLGALVKDNQGKLFGLSNNHVVASCNCAEVGLPIVAPGLADVAAKSLSPFTLGLHAAALPLAVGNPSVVNVPDNTDAAIFAINDPGCVSSFQGTAYDTPTQVAPIAPGMRVKKVGRTTGLTSGDVVSQMFGPFCVNYSAPQYGFASPIFFENVFAVAGIGTLFSDSGDSGSLVVSEINGLLQAVGIVFAGMNDGKAPGGKLSLVLPIQPILLRLQVSLVSGHNI